MQVREMEAKLKQYGISEMTTNPQDFISRKDHARICDARVSAREADLQVTILLPCCTTVCLSACLSVCPRSGSAGHCLVLCLSVYLSVSLPGKQTCGSLSCALSVCLSV